MKNEGMTLHHWIATGHDPKDFEGCVESDSTEASEKENYE